MVLAPSSIQVGLYQRFPANEVATVLTDFQRKGYVVLIGTSHSITSKGLRYARLREIGSIVLGMVLTGVCGYAIFFSQSYSAIGGALFAAVGGMFSYIIGKRF